MNFLKDKRVLAAIGVLIALVLGAIGFNAVVTPKDEAPTPPANVNAADLIDSEMDGPVHREDQAKEPVDVDGN